MRKRCADSRTACCCRVAPCDVGGRHCMLPPATSWLMLAHGSCLLAVPLCTYYCCVPPLPHRHAPAIAATNQPTHSNPPAGGSSSTCPCPMAGRHSSTYWWAAGSLPTASHTPDDLRVFVERDEGFSSSVVTTQQRAKAAQQMSAVKNMRKCTSRSSAYSCCCLQHLLLLPAAPAALSTAPPPTTRVLTHLVRSCSCCTSG